MSSIIYRYCEWIEKSYFVQVQVFVLVWEAVVTIIEFAKSSNV